jgi:tRNA A37 methylthiotransferase MiaB
MPIMENMFGEGTLNSVPVGNKIYAECTACMSIYSEFSSWAIANHHRMVNDPKQADTIVVLGCQVTDLSVLNNLRTLDKLMGINPSAKFYMGGCLARRFDIPLPDGVLRLDRCCADGQDLELADQFMTWQDPYWVTDFKDDTENPSSLKGGNLFRHHYPLRIGVGCQKNCSYCTIKHTRGSPYEIPTELSMKEFLAHDNIVLIADSPSEKQIRFWINKSLEHNKPISIRNIEPNVAFALFDELEYLSYSDLLPMLHVPIQSDRRDVLKDMCRPVETTLALLFELPKLKNKTVLATNVIVEYKGFPNPDMGRLGDIFKYISWNPYWDGQWYLTRAISRWDYYIRGHWQP